VEIMDKVKSKKTITDLNKIEEINNLMGKIEILNELTNFLDTQKNKKIKRYYSQDLFDWINTNRRLINNKLVNEAEKNMMEDLINKI